MPPPLRTQVDQLLQKITEVIGEAAGIRGRQVAPQQRELLVERTRELKRALDASVYPHPLPPAVFDPADTRLFGRFAAIALVAQERIALKDVEHIYGSGVYALYYLGPRPEYAPISGTETPVYVGKTQPKAGANAAVEQGTAITSRLGTHRTAITNAVNLDPGLAVNAPLREDDPRHGTPNGYGNLGCRCDRCRAANAATRRAYLARVRSEGRVLGEHGSEVAYDSGCRCSECRGNHNAKARVRDTARRRDSRP